MDMELTHDDKRSIERANMAHHLQKIFEHIQTVQRINEDNDAFKMNTEDREMLINTKYRIESIKLSVERDREAQRQELLSQGWQEFVFESTYYGSHEEYSEGDEKKHYLFHPSVDLTEWNHMSFSHGHCGQHENNDMWFDYINSIPDKWVELE